MGRFPSCSEKQAHGSIGSYNTITFSCWAANFLADSEPSVECVPLPHRKLKWFQIKVSERSNFKSGSGKVQHPASGLQLLARESRSWWDHRGCYVRSVGWRWSCKETTLPPSGQSHEDVDRLKVPPAEMERKIYGKVA